MDVIFLGTGMTTDDFHIFMRIIHVYGGKVALHFNVDLIA